jgi:hypothetical protein
VMLGCVGAHRFGIRGVGCIGSFVGGRVGGAASRPNMPVATSRPNMHVAASRPNMHVALCCWPWVLCEDIIVTDVGGGLGLAMLFG